METTNKCEHCGIESIQPNDVCRKWTPTHGETIWIKDIVLWTWGTYIGYDPIRESYIVREKAVSEGRLVSSKDILPYSAKPNKSEEEDIAKAAKVKYDSRNNEYLNEHDYRNGFADGAISSVSRHYWFSRFIKTT